MIEFNPNLTTAISDAFVLETHGFVQGVFLDDPAIRYQLEGGKVGPDVSQPLWGGLAISLAVPPVGMEIQGSVMVPATSLASINGWTCVNQSMNGIITPSSNVPLYAAGASLNFFRPGSNARLCVAVENTTVLDALAGDAPNVDVYWDPTNLCITNSSSGTYGPLPVQLMTLSASSKIVTYSGGNANWNSSGPAAIIRI
jgi:hypothetical protein